MLDIDEMSSKEIQFFNKRDTVILVSSTKANLA
jgi:hypothetical protein